MTREQIRALISSLCDGANELVSAIGTELKRNDDGSIVDDSDLGIAVREVEHIAAALSRLSLKLSREGMVAAPPEGW